MACPAKRPMLDLQPTPATVRRRQSPVTYASAIAFLEQNAREEAAVQTNENTAPREQLAPLVEENAAVHEQFAALMAENAGLREQLSALGAEAAGMRAKAAQLETAQREAQILLAQIRESQERLVHLLSLAGDAPGTGTQVPPHARPPRAFGTPDRVEEWQWAPYGLTEAQPPL